VLLEGVDDDVAGAEDAVAPDRDVQPRAKGSPAVVVAGTVPLGTRLVGVVRSAGASSDR